MTRINGFIDSFVGQTGFRQHGGIFSGISFGNMIHASSGTISISGAQQVIFSAFGGQGNLRFSLSGNFGGWEVGGPTQIGWPITFNTQSPEGYFPIAVSGMMGFQTIYRGNRNDIYLIAQYGDMRIVGDTAKFRPTVGGRANPRLSGILYVPVTTGNTNNEQGDFMSCLHSVMTPVPKFAGSSMNNYADPADSIIMKAQALGIGTLFFNTGSGIANISMGSGIEATHFRSYKGGSTYPLEDTKERYVRLPINTAVIDDRNITVNAGPTGLSIQSPGLYRCQYSATFNRVTVNNTIREVAVRAILAQNQAATGGGGTGIPTGGTNSIVIPQSISYGFASNAQDQRCDVKHTFLFNADADDFFGLEATMVDATAAGDGLNLTTSGTLVMIQKIGPKRGNFN